MSGRVLENKVIAIRNDQNYYCYDWIIKFSCICNDCILNADHWIDSPKFTSKSILPEDWKLILISISATNSIILKMKLDAFIDKNIFENCRLRIGVRNRKGVICYSTVYENLTDSLELHWNDFQQITNYLFTLEFINWSYIYNCNYLPEGVLKFVVEIFKKEDVIPIGMKSTTTHATKVLKNLQQSDKFSDVTLVVGEREFRAHKAVLAAQSTVFLAMFEHDMTEKAENKVIIEDIEDEIMQVVLNYMYTGTAEKQELQDTAIDVLVAADKYALEDLVKICEEALIQGLNNDNVFKVLQTADSHKLNSLKKAAINCIARELEVLVESIELKNLLINSTDLFKEIILAVKNTKQLSK